jgi:AraC-like DNA-binding protein
VIGRVRLGDEEDARRAIAAAKRAFSSFSRTSKGGSSGDAAALSEIAYACGFRDYTHFARRFRHRFGHVPGAHSAGDGYAATEQCAPVLGTKWRMRAAAANLTSTPTDPSQ